MREAPPRATQLVLHGAHHRTSSEAGRSIAFGSKTSLVLTQSTVGTTHELFSELLNTSQSIVNYSHAQQNVKRESNIGRQLFGNVQAE
jgi:hypothetical protein